MGIKKIVHLADIHIRTYKLHDEYKEVFKALLSDLTVLLSPYAKEEVRIVIAGDLVHQKIIISNEQLILGTWLVMKLEELAPVVIIAGNHDMLENNRERVDSITPMVQFLPHANVNYFKKSNCYLDDNIVWCVYSIFDENATPDIKSAKEQFGTDKTYVGLYHAPIMNAKTDVGYTFDNAAGLSIFEGCDMVLLGDIHKRQSFNFNGTLIAYPSSLIQQNFGETVSNHGFLFWDVETKTFTEHNVNNDYALYTFKLKSIDELENNIEVLINP